MDAIDYQSMGDQLAEALAGSRGTTTTTTFGTIRAVGDASLDVEVRGALLKAVPATAGAMSHASEGRRCVITSQGPLSTVTDVIARPGDAGPQVIDGWSVSTVGELCVCARSYTATGSFAINQTWGTGLLYYGYITLPSYPVTYASAPTVGYSLSKSTPYDAWCGVNNGSATATSPGRVTLYRPAGATATLTSVTIDVIAVGAIA